MTGRIILVRHGQTTSNVERLLDTDPPGAELTELGREQASAVGTELASYCGAGNGSLGRIAGMYCGISLRTQQTAMLAARAIEKAAGLGERALRVHPTVGIHELAAGEMEMRGDEEAHHAYAVAMAGWLRGDAEARMAGEFGESITDILARYQPVLETIATEHELGTKDRDVIVVSHGAAIRTMATHATRIDPEFAFAGYLANCRFIVLAPGGREFGAWELVRWADLDRQI